MCMQISLFLPFKFFWPEVAGTENEWCIMPSAQFFRGSVIDLTYVSGVVLQDNQTLAGSWTQIV